MEKKQVSIDDFMKRDRKGPNGLTRIPQRRSLANLNVVKPNTDIATLRADAWICDSTIDRQGEVILPERVRLDNYANNPVVLFEHGMSGIVLPLGTSENPETSEIAVALTDGKLEASTWFSESNKEGYQIFGLIQEGVVRATSIQVIPDHDGVFTYFLEDGREVDVTEAGEMVEYSWCTLGMNPNALRKSWFANDNERDHVLIAVHGQIESAQRVLRVGSLGSNRLLPSVKKSLLSLVPRPNTTGVGSEFEEETMSKKKATLAQLRKLSNAQLKSMMSNDEYDEETQEQAKAMLGDEEVVDETQIKSETGEGGGEGDGAAVTETTGEESSESAPLGATVLSDFRGMIGTMIEIIKDAMKPVENTTVRDALDSELATLQECQATLEGAYASAYPDLPPLTSAPEDGAPVDDASTQMKSMLANDSRKNFQFHGLRQRLQQISGAKNLTDAQRKSLLATVTDFDRLQDASRKFRPGTELKAVQDQVKNLTEKLDGLLSKATK